MNFKQWLIVKYINYDTPKGDFARDVKNTMLSDRDKEIFEDLDLLITDSTIYSIYQYLKKEYLTKGIINIKKEAK